MSGSLAWHQKVLKAKLESLRYEYATGAGSSHTTQSSGGSRQCTASTTAAEAVSSGMLAYVLLGLFTCIKFSNDYYNSFQSST